MTRESDCPYGENNIEVLSIRESVLKRPGMYFGDLQDGSAYARTIQSLVHMMLSWQIGANMHKTQIEQRGRTLLLQRVATGR